MVITVNLRYKGKNGSALAFAKEMTESGTVEKYDLHMTVERYISAETPETEEKFIRK